MKETKEWWLLWIENGKKALLEKQGKREVNVYIRIDSGWIDIPKRIVHAVVAKDEAEALEMPRAVAGSRGHHMVSERDETGKLTQRDHNFVYRCEIPTADVALREQMTMTGEVATTTDFVDR